MTHRRCGNPWCPVCAARDQVELIKAKNPERWRAFEVTDCGRLERITVVARYEITPLGRAALEADPSQLEIVGIDASVGSPYDADSCLGPEDAP